MKKVTTLIISSVLLIVVVLTIFIVIIMDFGMFKKTDETADVVMNRYFAICTNPQLDGWQDIKTGLQKASDAHKSAIEFLEAGFEDDRADASCIEMAVDSGADGIIVYGSDKTVDLELDYAADKSVPVIFVVNEYDHDRIFQLSSDPALFASKMVYYVNGIESDHKNIAIISSGQSSYKAEQFQTLFDAKGYNTIVKSFSGPHVFDANETVKDLISSQNEIDMVCCLDATATLGVAQSIVDLNKVNVITIIGSGKTNEVLNMIRKGVVTATVALDYEKIGSEAINILSRYASKPISYKKHILSDIYVIDKSNVRSYMEVAAE